MGKRKRARRSRLEESNIQIENTDDVGYIIEGRYMREQKKKMSLMFAMGLIAIVVGMTVDNEIVTSMMMMIILAYFVFIIKHLVIIKRKIKRMKYEWEKINEGGKDESSILHEVQS